MSERRPHWDDELIFAVMSAAGDGGHLFIDDIHAVIAAVEDWHKAKRDSRDRTHSAECWRWHQECAEHLIERQRSTIQRVRDVYYGPVGLLDTRIQQIGDILRALDGDGDA